MSNVKPNQAAPIAAAGTTDKAATVPAGLKKDEVSYSEKFSNMVIREFSSSVGGIELTSFQKRLIQNYFISIEMSLRTAEEKRLKKSEQYRDPVAVTWSNVNMNSLALNVVACARIGYDPALPNHISMIPYKNNKTGKYDIGFIEGYRGKELKAKKYGYDIPDDIVVKLVFEGEIFTPIYKDKDHQVETYIHTPSEDPFAKRVVKGGYYYHSFKDEPEKNKLMFYNLHDIEKRKPAYASSEFWGGEKPTYDDKGKKNGTETIEGYHEEMCWKTIYRMAYGAITIDSEKIDDNVMKLLEIEREMDSAKESLQPENVRNNAISQKGSRMGITAEDVKFEDIDGSSQAPTPQFGTSAAHGAPAPAATLSDLGKKGNEDLPY
jgi:recombination protein RecT